MEAKREAEQQVICDLEDGKANDDVNNGFEVGDGDFNRKEQLERASNFSENEIGSRDKRAKEDKKQQVSENQASTVVEPPKMNGGDDDENHQHQLLPVRPHSLLPKPEAPPGLAKSSLNGTEEFRQMEMERSVSVSDKLSIGKFIRDRSNSFSEAIVKRVSSLKEKSNIIINNSPPKVTEFNLSGLKVIVQVKNFHKEVDFKGRISFFSRSNCRDCSAVRSLFCERGLKFVEINVDVFPLREKELMERTGSAKVPQIFFNEKLFGGLIALNSLRNSGEFDTKLKELLAKRCPQTAPSAPVYGFDDPEDVEQRTDDIIGIVRVLRQRLPIQDRLTKMKIVKNCFAGSEMVEVMIHHLDCGRKKAVEIGREIARKHFIHHVFGENDFADGNHLYRFLEHEPFIPKSFNFRGSINDCEPKSAVVVGKRLTKIMSAVLETYASEDRSYVDYTSIGRSEEFRRYVNLAQDLQRVDNDILALSTNEKLAFFLNLHNAMVIHAVIRLGCPDGVTDRRSFFGEFQYIVGGRPYSLATIKNGILRCNRRQPYSLVRPFGQGDRRLEVALPKVNPLIHFGLCNGTRSSPKMQFFSAQGIEAELRYATKEFFNKGGMEVDLDKRTVYLTRIIKWYNVDFGSDKEILKWIISFLDANRAGLLTHLMSDGGHVNIVYQDYDWSLNTWSSTHPVVGSVHMTMNASNGRCRNGSRMGFVETGKN